MVYGTIIPNHFTAVFLAPKTLCSQALQLVLTFSPLNMTPMAMLLWQRLLLFASMSLSEAYKHNLAFIEIKLSFYLKLQVTFSVPVFLIISFKPFVDIRIYCKYEITSITDRKLNLMLTFSFRNKRAKNYVCILKIFSK